VALEGFVILDRACAREGCLNVFQRVSGSRGGIREYCGEPECTRERRREWQENRVRPPSGPSGAKSGACSVCGKPVWVSRTSAIVQICLPCRSARRQRTCEQCGEQFEARGKDRPGLPNRFCSAACRVASRTLYADRRAASKAANRRRKANRRLTFDGVTDPQIFGRDHWTCQICGGPIDPDLPSPAPRSATVDHIIPVTRGGTDTAPNKRAAHRICNTRRGDRVSEAELALVMPDLAPEGVWPSRRPARREHLCASCGERRTGAAGVTCEVCRDAALAERARQIWIRRDRGVAWAEIAEWFSLGRASTAHNAAHGQADKDLTWTRGLPDPVTPGTILTRQSQPVPIREVRQLQSGVPVFWWTTVRPVSRPPR